MEFWNYIFENFLLMAVFFAGYELFLKNSKFFTLAGLELLDNLKWVWLQIVPFTNRVVVPRKLNTWNTFKLVLKCTFM